MRALLSCASWVLPLAAMLAPGPAAPHLLPAQTATMNIVGNLGYFAVSVPVSALRGVDLSPNGRLSADAFRARRAQIAAEFQSRFHVRDAGAAAVARAVWASPPHPEGIPKEGADYLVLLLVSDFGRRPDHPLVETDLFGAGPGEATMTMAATRRDLKGVREAAVLDPAHPRHAFFRGVWADFCDFVAVGAEHILKGPDHLLFIFTAAAATANWRERIGVISAFTAAHSLTLALAALGVLRAPPGLVEPSIAASIVVMALDNVLRPKIGGERIALVFACGLLHGLGFASALGDMGLDAGHRVASLAGFNLGVELGQLAFLSAILGFAALGGRILEVGRLKDWPKLASVAAAGGGVSLFVQRIWPALQSSRWG